MILALILAAALDGITIDGNRIDYTGRTLDAKGNECRLVWDKTQRNAVACVGRTAYLCNRPGKPCEEIELDPDPDCGKVAKKVCAPPDKFLNELPGTTGVVTVPWRRP